MARNVVAPRLYLAHDREHVGGEGVRCHPVCRYALGLCLGQVVRFPSLAPCAFFCANAALVLSAINARSFCARAAYRCSMNGSASAPSSVTMNGTRLPINREMNATSRERRQSFATTTGAFAFRAFANVSQPRICQWPLSGPSCLRKR